MDAAIRCLIPVFLLTLSACTRQESAPAESVAPPAEQPALAPVDVPAGEYKLDPAHASLIFRVDHLGFSNYTARFLGFDATLQFDPANLAASSVVVTIDPRSLETDFPNPTEYDFNAALQGPEWLASEQYPQMSWRSTRVETTGPRAAIIHGDFTFRGVTHPVALEATFNGGYAGHPMDPNARIGFSAHGSLHRSDFGMTTGIPAPGTTMGVSDEVEIIVEAEFSGPAWQDATSQAAE